MNVTENIGNSWASESCPRRSGWMLALGVSMFLLGMIGLVMATALTVASVPVFGALLAAGGVAQGIEAFPETGWKSKTPHVLIALIYMATGVLAMYDPMAASLSLTLFIASMLLVAGVLRAVMAFHMRPVRSWGWVLVGAVMSVLLGIAIIIQWPVSGLLAIGLFVALELMIAGWTCVVFALAAQSAARDSAPSRSSVTRDLPRHG